MATPALKLKHVLVGWRPVSGGGFMVIMAGRNVAAMALAGTVAENLHLIHKQETQIETGCGIGF